MTKIIRNLLRPFWRGLNILRGKDCLFFRDIKIETHRFGSEFGGWNLPVNTPPSDAVIYSAGVGFDLSFDLELIKKRSVQIHTFDPTPKSIEWLKKQPLPKTLQHHAWGIADYNGSAKFHLPKNPDHVSHSMVDSQTTTDESVEVEVKTISSIMKQLKHNRIDLLKMDIEGAEYTVLKELLKSSIRPKLLLVEFHHRFKSIGAKKTRTAVKELRSTGYQLYYVSKTGEELCFIYKDTTE